MLIVKCYIYWIFIIGAILILHLKIFLLLMEVGQNVQIFNPREQQNDKIWHIFVIKSFHYEKSKR